MHVAHLGILILECKYNLVEQMVQTLVLTRHNGDHRYADHAAQTVVVEPRPLLLQLVVHVQRYDDARVYIH